MHVIVNSTIRMDFLRDIATTRIQLTKFSVQTQEEILADERTLHEYYDSIFHNTVGYNYNGILNVLRQREPDEDLARFMDNLKCIADGSFGNVENNGEKFSAIIIICSFDDTDLSYLSPPLRSRVDNFFNNIRHMNFPIAIMLPHLDDLCETVKNYIDCWRTYFPLIYHSWIHVKDTTQVRMTNLGHLDVVFEQLMLIGECALKCGLLKDNIEQAHMTIELFKKLRNDENYIPTQDEEKLLSDM